MIHHLVDPATITVRPDSIGRLELRCGICDSRLWLGQPTEPYTISHLLGVAEKQKESHQCNT